MALASAYGLQYDLPQSNVAQGPIGVPGQQQAAQDFGSGNLLEDQLYVKEGVTDEYYKKVAALKSYANEVSSRYGFDVTRPDYRNPESVRFHRSYLEALADLQSTQNRLKRLASQENISLQSPNVARGTDELGNDYFVNTGSNDIVRRMAEAAQRVKSTEGAEGFEIARQDLIEQMQEELASAQSPQERDQLQATIRQLSAITTDTGISESAKAQYDLQERQMAETRAYRQQDLALRREQMEQRNEVADSPWGNLTKSQRSLLEGRIQRIQEIIDPASLKSMGIERVDRASGTYIEKTVNGKKQSFKIDPNDPRGTLENINEMLNMTPGSKVSMDLFYQTNLPLEQVAAEIISKMSPAEDNYSKMLDSFATIATQAKDNQSIRQSLASSLSSGEAIIPASIATSFTKGATKDYKVKTIEEGSSFSGSPYIKITLDAGKGTSPNKKFFLDDPEQVEMLKKIFKANERVADMPPNIANILGMGTNVAPSSSGGPTIEIDNSKM